MTQRNPIPPGIKMQDEAMLSEIMRSDVSTVFSTRPVESTKQPNIQDWLHEDHRRNELKRHVEHLQRAIGRVELFLVVGMAFIVLVLAMQLLLLSTGL